MKKTAAIVALLATAIATPAAAQSVTGTVTIIGSVAPKCQVLSGAGSTFGTAVDLEELAQANGTLRTDIAADFNVASGLEARVVCTSAAPTISVNADAIATSTAPAAGYANTINFTAHVAVDTVTINDVPFSNDSAVAAGSPTLIGGRLANNGGNNITITASNFRTANIDDLLVAATDYQGQIVVVIAPSA